MAIVQVPFPTTPSPVTGDWAYMVDLIKALGQNNSDPAQVDGSNIPEGAVFVIGGDFYKGTSDTAITGTSSDYVKITLSTLAASFVSSLSGVTWNKTYNGYYDTTGNLYIFDEITAYLNGDISTFYTAIGKAWFAFCNQSLKTFDSPTLNKITLSKGRIPSLYSTGGATSIATLYSDLDPLIPNLGDSIFASGVLYDISPAQSGDLFFVTRISRHISTLTLIVIDGFKLDLSNGVMTALNPGQYNLTNTDTTTNSWQITV